MSRRGAVRFFGYRCIVFVLLSLIAGSAAAQIGPGPFAVFPSQSTTDGRFLGFSCPGTASFEQGLTLGLAIPADQAAFDISIFDGDTGKVDGGGLRHWDLGTRQLVFRLYADPLRQLSTSPANLVGEWRGNDPNAMSGPLWTASSDSMPDNDWWGVNVATSAQAQAPSGNFFYTLTIDLDGACNVGESLESSIKLAASNPLAFLVPRFGLVGGLRQTFNDGPIIYPGPTFPPPGNDFVNAPTTYDGTMEFFFTLPPGERDLRLYDGDFDHGTNLLAGLPSGTVLQPCIDNDDPDTSLLYDGFPFSTAGVTPEGIKGPGVPADDNNLDIFRRGEPGAPGRLGCVRYEVTAPDGTVYRNDNPSGSFEWEQFRIAAQTADDPANADYTIADDFLPSGLWQVRVIGLDLANLNFFFANACSTRLEGGQPTAACPVVSVYLTGDTVFFDLNGNGVQDEDEPGIPGVVLELLRSPDLPPFATATTGDTSMPNWEACVANNTGVDEQGLYCFGVDEPGDYIVRVAAGNFEPGGALYGYAPTNGNELSNTLVDGNVLTYDFGYRGTGSLGDLVWYDANGDGVQDDGEEGIADVTLELLDADGEGGDVLATTVTGADGLYLFDNLAPGTYTVRVVTSTLPAGLAQTYDLDGMDTAGAATATLEPGADRTDVDFGYRGTASLGDRVWNDLDADGVQEAGEAGLNGVFIELVDDGGNVVATQVTSGDGNYTFTNLATGTYTVRVVSATLPAGHVQTYDLDGIGTPHTVSGPVTESRTDVDFGYRNTNNLSVGDRVWNDADGDGFQDVGEAGLNGVTVQLYNSSGTVIATQVTSGNGNYTFTNLAPGLYAALVVSSTLPAGYVQTYDLDGTGTPHYVAGLLTESRTDVDFGYKATAACTAGYFKDHLDSASFSRNDGTLSWSGSWIESDVAGSGVSSGNVTVGHPYGGYFFLRDSPDTGTQPSAARQVNLTGFATATLSFSFHVRTGVDPDDAVVIEVSKDGGASYTVLETLKGYSGAYEGTRSYNISSFIAGNTRIRFRVSANYGAGDELFKLDWVKIDAGCGSTTPQTGSIGNRVWKDLDGDGAQDSGEPGLNGVTVKLLNSSGTVLATQITSGDGNYQFTGLAAATYKVRVESSTLPSGLAPTYDLDGTGTAHIATVALAAGQNRTEADFGYRTPPACAAGYFKDHLDSASFSRNDGSLMWSGSWVEHDTAGAGVSKGNVTVGTPYAGYLFLRDSPDTGTQPSAARQVNLTGFSSATLRFEFHVRTGIDPDDAVVVEVSKNGGASYTVLATLKGFSGTYEGTRSYDISSYIASNTRIRFRVSANYGAGDELFKLDWVKIDAGCQ